MNVKSIDKSRVQRWSLTGCSMIALAAGAFVLSAPAAQAQAGEGAVDEVVVTAQFREQNLQNTPLAITAVNAAMLEARSQVSITDVANQAPNVTLKVGSAPFGPSLQAFIRGVGQSDFNFALEPGVGMYVDDVYYSTLTGSVFDLLDVDRVEILRGPQGTLAGQNSIGGAVKLYSKKPTGQNGGFVEVTGGSYNRIDVRAAAEFTLVPDKLFARIAGVSHHKDGYVTRYDYACTHPGSGVPTYATGNSCKLGTEGGKSYAAFRFALRWTPTSKLDVNLIGDYTHDNSEVAPLTLLYVGHVPGANPPCAGGPGMCPFPAAGRTSRLMAGPIPFGTPTGSAFITYSPFGGGNWAQDTFTKSPYVNYSTYTNPSTTSGTPAYTNPLVNRVGGWGMSLNADYQIAENLNLTSITAYRFYEGDWSVDQDTTPIGNSHLHNIVWHRQFSQEVRLNGRFMDRVDYTVGGFYFDQSSHYGGRVDLVPSNLDFIENDYIPGKTKAVFANVDWQVFDKLHLIGGARYSDIQKTFIYGRLGVPGNTTWNGGAPPAVAPLNNTSGRFEGTRWDWRAAAQYQFAPQFMAYLQFATGFKSGGINPRPFFPVQSQPHNPEQLDGFEIGAKSQWLENRLRVNVSAFLNKYKDILITVNSCPFPGAPAAPCALPVNAGKADVKGFEIETNLRPTSRLAIDASLSYLDFEYTSLSAAALASGVTLGMRTAFAPKWKWSIGAQYEFDIGGWGTLTPRVDVSRQSNFNSGAINSAFNLVPGYTLTNGRLTWRDEAGDWSAALEVANLLDKLYYASFFDNRNSSQGVFGAPAAPRTFALKVKRNF